MGIIHKLEMTIHSLLRRNENTLRGHLIENYATPHEENKEAQMVDTAQSGPDPQQKSTT